MEASDSAPNPVAKSNKTVAVLLGALVLIVAIGLIAFLALRTSPEEKALQAVCEARTSIEQHVQNLATMTPTSFTVSAVQADIKGITSGINTIRTNEKELGIDRRQEIQQATSTFFSQVGAVGKSLLTSTSVDDAKKAVETSGQQLLQSFEQTLAPVDCSSVS